MPTITAQTLIDRAEVILQDTTNIRWPASELLGWLNDGQREVVMLRPDAFAKTASMALVSGTKQSIPSDGYSLLKVVRNMGSGGSTPGRAVRKVPQELLDSQNPDWHAATATSVVQHYAFDSRSPKIFYVYPPSLGTTQIELLYSAAPTDVAAIGNTITLDDIYANPLIDYILFRAYSKDMEDIGNKERAVAHRQSFENSLGLKAQSDAATAPTNAVRG